VDAGGAFVVEPAESVFSWVVAYRGMVPRPTGYPVGTMRMWVGRSRHFLAFPVRAGQLLTYVGFVPSGTSVRESWSALGDAAAPAAHFAGWDPAIGEVIAAISGPGRQRTPIGDVRLRAGDRAYQRGVRSPP
jgi:salicylate hydroxylase